MKLDMLVRRASLTLGWGVGGGIRRISVQASAGRSKTSQTVHALESSIHEGALRLLKLHFPL